MYERPKCERKGESDLEKGKVPLKLDPKSTSHEARNAGFDYIEDFCSLKDLKNKINRWKLICKRCSQCLKFTRDRYLDYT